eukprot:UN04587
MKPPTLRQIRESLEVSPLLPLTKPWGHVFSPNRVFCTVPSVYPDKTKVWDLIIKTWGSLCDVLVFIVTPANDPPEEWNGARVWALDIDRSTDPKERNIWEKVWRTWLTIATTDMVDEAEWFLKIDDDTMFSPENFKGFTRYLDPEEKYYIGHTILWRWQSSNIIFNSGSCYAMSRGAITELVGP